MRKYKKFYHCTCLKDGKILDLLILAYDRNDAIIKYLDFFRRHPEYKINKTYTSYLCEIWFIDKLLENLSVNEKEELRKNDITIF